MRIRIIGPLKSPAQWLRRRRCPHSNLEGIYGDEINATGGLRLYCWDCHRFLDGPVSLAASRKGERDA